MRVVRLPSSPRALILDLDNTLYTHAEYAAFQEDILVERLSRELGEDLRRTRSRISALREERKKAGMGKTSLGNIFADLGFDISTSVKWREEHIDPRVWLKKDARLGNALLALGKRFKLALVTNNPRSVGEKSLETLGVREHFDAVIGLDDTMVSKPAREPFETAAMRLNCEAGSCVSVGDRYDVDLAPALELGMGAILVDGVEDVYGLPELFDGKATRYSISHG